MALRGFIKCAGNLHEEHIVVTYTFRIDVFDGEWVLPEVVDVVDHTFLFAEALSVKLFLNLCIVEMLITLMS